MSHMINPRYAGQAQTEMGSGSIWHDLPGNINEPGKGWMLYDNFSNLSIIGTGSALGYGGYSVYADTGGFIRSPSTAVADPGVEFGSDGDNEIATALYSGGAKMLLAATAPAAWFECEVSTSIITSAAQGIMAGVVERTAAATNVLLDDSDALADLNMVMFHKLEGTGVWGIGYKADGQTAQVLVAGVKTPVAATRTRLGFKLRPKAPISKRVAFYVDGVELSTYLTTTQMAAATFPSDINLGPGFSANNATGSSPGVTTFYWWRAAQCAYLGQSDAG